MLYFQLTVDTHRRSRNRLYILYMRVYPIYRRSWVQQTLYFKLCTMKPTVGHVHNIMLPRLLI